MIGRHEFRPDVAIEARPAPARPGYSWLAVLISRDEGETWEVVCGPPFTSPSEYGPDMVAVKCWPNQQLDAAHDWHLCHIALTSATRADAFDVDDRATLDRLYARLGAVYH